MERAVQRREVPRRRLGVLAQRFGVAIALVVLAALLSVLSPDFLTVSNVLNIARQVSINAILAAGMTVVILTAGIDLSVGSVLALSGAIAAGVMQRAPVTAAIVAALAVGLLAGTANGLAVAVGRAAPFVATLAMLTIARGATLVYTDGRPITGLPDAFLWLGNGDIAGIPVPVWLMLLVFVLGYLLLNHMVLGRFLYAVGGNEEAARLAGVNVGRAKIAAYMISGVLSAVAALVLTARLNSAQPTAGSGYELDAIAAVVVGGTTLAGGEGTIGGTLLGAFLIGVLNNGLNLLNVSSFYQQIVKGVVILLAVLLDRRIRRGR